MAYRGVMKARIKKLFGGDVTVEKARKLKARKDATPRDKQLANCLSLGVASFLAFNFLALATVTLPPNNFFILAFITPLYAITFSFYQNVF